jgi:pimeloyl-ACP methyl ester carboxylesterase
MLALYRSGRQAEALRAYQQARRTLADELGLEPSQELKQLEQAMLTQDGTLTSEPPVAPAAAPIAPRTPAGRRPEVHYTRSGDVNIAYQIVGEGPRDLVLVSGFVSHLQLDWEERRLAYFLERLASFSRLIRFDKRGTGLSDRPGGLPDLETRMDDVRAVMDAAGSERAALFGSSEGGPMSVLFAATHPSRTTALVLYGTYAKRRDPDGDYPWAPTWEERQRYAAEIEQSWGWEADMKRMTPSADEAMAEWWARRAQAAASPGAARDLILMNSQVDIRRALPTVTVPTLVLHRTGDIDSRVEEGRYIAERIPGARFAAQRSRPVGRRGPGRRRGRGVPHGNEADRQRDASRVPGPPVALPALTRSRGAARPEHLHLPRACARARAWEGHPLPTTLGLEPTVS